MKKLLLIAVLLFSGMANALVVAPPQAPVTNIYEVDFARGNNANPCTTARPCKTVSGAAAKVTKSNSIIYVRGVGTEETAQSVLAPGVSIRCEKTTTYIKAMTALAPMIQGYSANQGTVGNQSISNCTLDGNNRLGIAAVEFKGREFVGYDNVTIKDWDDHGADLLGTSTAAADNLINKQVAKKLARGVYFTNSTCTNSAKFSGYGRGCLQIGSLDSPLIQNNTFSEDTRAGVGGSNGWNIKFLRGGGVKDAKILSNTFAREAKDGDAFNFNVEMYGFIGKTEVAYNTFSGAFDVNGSFPNTEGSSIDYHDNEVVGSAFNVATCTTIQCKPTAIILEFNTFNVYIRKNRFRNVYNVVDLQFHNTEGVVYMDNIHFEDNLAYSVCRTLTQGGTSATVLARYSNLYWQGNTLYGAGSTICGGVGWALGIDSTADFSGLYFKNNIVVNFFIAPIMFAGNTSKMMDSVDIDSNVFFNNGNGNNPWQNGVTVTNYRETNTIKSDPLFKNASGLLNTPLDFKISGSSPAKFTGVNGILFEDNLGAIRESATSIGAIEYWQGD